MKPRVLITGASGMLGRSLFRLLSAEPDAYEILGTAYSRVVPPLERLDLTDTDSMNALFEKFEPNFVVHCAAERDPDRAAADKEGVLKLNVEASAAVARFCNSHNATLIYISTDYVFDGGVETNTSPPYAIDAETNPLNFYGLSKRDGERAVLEHGGETAVCLRVPVLYAKDCKDVTESSSLTVAKSLLSTTEQKVDNWGLRFPTLVDDVAAVLKHIIDRKTEDPKLASGILHCSSGESATKYQQAIMMAEILGTSTEKLHPDSEPPQGAPRPQNTQLDCSATWKAIGLEHTFTPLREGFSEALQRFKEEHFAKPGGEL
eukprot:CAMPEP_0206540318 /NCGR_PEP_ID=MMETSP0325_2-20121206/8918_1 /ASSEMBLY_ACC=CAM_ASM_000347 /TAXON_ID=2866 /ORGANISM="Crypthecodinium cohnii, Strain Seligo" /LENGTH=318 /DNA_ID=CAMNT_0054037987 /DNA_START=90 /DNA_END=1046 /DNA_ORIENTATION=-